MNSEVKDTELTLLRKQNTQLEQDIAHVIKHDQLTGLMNRAAFINAVDASLLSLPSEDNAALIEIGIRDLPRMTGVLGRHAGDYAVSALAARLHFSQFGNALTCRLDYWTFAVFVPNLTDSLAALTTAKSIIETLSQPIDWVDRKLVMSVAAGVALRSPDDGRDANSLLHNAGLALKVASDKGGPGYSFYNPTLALAAKRKSDLQQLIQDATDRHLFELVYQPFFDMKTGALSGFEALMRLNHPEAGIISPIEFIPIAEETGLISRIGAMALAEACRCASEWPSHLTVAVNISPEQFYSGNLITDVHNALELSSFPAYRLEIEITEGTLLKDSELVMQQLTSLREMGCSIVLDDFGTGYSSLSYLWKFPFSKLKIDRSFIQALESSPMVKGMIRSIIDLSRNLGLRVTAEGIETMEQMTLLRSQGCEYLQGYLCGKPTAKQDLAAVILTNFAQQLLPPVETKLVAVA
jgi:diguanylate cyclase (GGDEF)-like protein